MDLRNKRKREMKKILNMVLAITLVFSVFPAHAQKEYQDINLYAECSAVFSVLAKEKSGKLPQDTIDSYYSASATFYKVALAKGGEEMKAVYGAKAQELENISRKDTIAVQQKKALEKQCRLAARELDIYIRK